MAGRFEGKTVLVVDDDPDIITAIKAGLADSGVHLETAGDGTTAVKLAESKNPDLVILDIMLPQKSGFLVLEQLRRDRSPGEKPHIIMITGNQGKRHRQYAEALGVADYISKPFAMERLVNAAEKLLAD